MAVYVDWPAGQQTYRYWFLSNPSTSGAIKDHPGNYMFVRRVIGGWLPVYIGIADSLRDRIPGHERWAEAEKLGATHVMSHTQTSQKARKAEEKALIARWNPPLNSQHRTRGTGLAG